MAIPLFFEKSLSEAVNHLTLDEETSRHIVSVLRMRKGDKINLTNGVGLLSTCEIEDDHKKKCIIHPVSFIQHPAPSRSVTIAISLIKNSTRFEWFLEKAAEIGINRIIPMVCERTEKLKFRYDRMQNILVSAMLQSQQVWLPVLDQVKSIREVISGAGQDQKFIAHCEPSEKRSLADLINENLRSHIILIGPEGDFTVAEIEMATAHHFTGVTLGETRLRTETAGMVASVLLVQGIVPENSRS